MDISPLNIATQSPYNATEFLRILAEENENRDQDESDDGKNYYCQQKYRSSRNSIEVVQKLFASTGNSVEKKEGKEETE